MLALTFFDEQAERSSRGEHSLKPVQGVPGLGLRKMKEGVRREYAVKSSFAKTQPCHIHYSEVRAEYQPTRRSYHF